MANRLKTALKPSTKEAANASAAAWCIPSRTRRCSPRDPTTTGWSSPGSSPPLPHSGRGDGLRARHGGAGKGPGAHLRRLSAGGRVAAGGAGTVRLSGQRRPGAHGAGLRAPARDAHARRLRAGGGRVDRRRGAPLLPRALQPALPERAG